MDTGRRRSGVPVRAVESEKTARSGRFLPISDFARTTWLNSCVLRTARWWIAEEGLRGRLEDVASNAVAKARVSERWRVRPTEPIRVRRIEYDLDEPTDLPVPAAFRVIPSR